MNIKIKKLILLVIIICFGIGLIFNMLIKKKSRGQ